MKLLLDLYPDARFIHIHRNPYHVYRSTWKLYQKILPIFSFQHIDTNTLEKYILDSYKKLFKAYLSEKHLIAKENLIEFSYDTFINNPMETMKTIYDALRISGFNNARPFFQEYVDKHKNYKASSYNFTDKEKQKIYHEWKFMFDAYGYQQ